MQNVDPHKRDVALPTKVASAILECLEVGKPGFSAHTREVRAEGRLWTITPVSDDSDIPRRVCVNATIPSEADPLEFAIRSYEEARGSQLGLRAQKPALAHMEGLPAHQRQQLLDDSAVAAKQLEDMRLRCVAAQEGLKVVRDGEFRMEYDVSRFVGGWVYFTPAPDAPEKVAEIDKTRKAKTEEAKKSAVKKDKDAPAKAKKQIEEENAPVDLAADPNMKAVEAEGLPPEPEPELDEE
jgi:hypothetical protein